MASALQAFIDSVAGGPCWVKESTASIGVAEGLIVDHNFERMALAIINTSANTLSLKPGKGATTTNGIILNPNGGSLTVNARDDLALVGWEWWGIAGGAASSIIVFEVIRFSRTQQAGG